VQGACYEEPPAEWRGEKLLNGQCIIRTVGDLFHIQGSRTATSDQPESILIISNLYLLRQVSDSTGNSDSSTGGGFTTLVQATAAAVYLHRLTLDGGKPRAGQLPERGRGLLSLSSVVLAERAPPPSKATLHERSRGCQMSRVLLAGISAGLSCTTACLIISRRFRYLVALFPQVYFVVSRTEGENVQRKQLKRNATP
jgi:hypothetical protein